MLPSEWPKITTSLPGSEMRVVRVKRIKAISATRALGSKEAFVVMVSTEGRLMG